MQATGNRASLNPAAELISYFSRMRHLMHIVSVCGRRMNRGLSEMDDRGVGHLLAETAAPADERFQLAVDLAPSISQTAPTRAAPPRQRVPLTD